MNKKLGIILMFVGAYVILLGGLFWNMSLPDPTPEGYYAGNVYDWFWGVSAAIVIAIGAALSLKKNFLCPIGCGITLLGVGYSLAIVFVGSAKEAYFSYWILIGAILAIASIVITVIFYIKEADHIKKHGPILM